MSELRELTLLLSVVGLITQRQTDLNMGKGKLSVFSETFNLLGKKCRFVVYIAFDLDSFISIFEVTSAF